MFLSLDEWPAVEVVMFDDSSYFLDIICLNNKISIDHISIEISRVDDLVNLRLFLLLKSLLGLRIPHLLQLSIVHLLTCTLSFWCLRRLWTFLSRLWLWASWQNIDVGEKSRLYPLFKYREQTAWQILFHQLVGIFEGLTSEFARDVFQAHQLHHKQWE